MDTYTDTYKTQSRTRLWAAAFLLVAALVAAIILVRMYMQPEIPEEPAYKPPIVSPEINSLEDVKEFTGGRPVPEVSTTQSAGNIVSYDHVRGSADAKITIVEYANLTNEYAGIIQPELKKLVEENENVNVIFRHFPSPDVENDYNASYLSECVFNQLGEDGFWSYIDIIFENGVGSKDELISQGEDIGANGEVLQTCLDSMDTEKRVKDDKRLGYVLGQIRITPTFLFVNNETGETRVMEGVDTMDFVQSIIDTMLKP